MTTYILMRNNKQSAPLKLEELLQTGFKPYDLIWIEGKSAMWRYPSEIAELKDFAETVEEQLYDRIYSKNKPDEKSNQYESEHKEKQVYVAFPDKKNTAINKVSATVQKTAKPIEHLPENIPVTETKFSQPLDDIKEMYAANLRNKKNVMAERLIIFKSVKKVSLYTGLIAFGIGIGFIFFYSKSKPDTLLSRQDNTSNEATLPVSNQQYEKKETKISADETKLINDAAPQLYTMDAGIANTEQKANIEKKTVNQSSTGLQKQEKNLSLNKPINTVEISPGVETNNTNGERSKKKRTGNEESTHSPLNPAKELNRLVSLKSNNYQRGAFGGIRNLELTITNQSKYLLDKVVVELQYLKPSEQSLRSENIIFSSIPPDGVLTIAVPPSNRGIKVAYKILKIESKELANETAGL